MSKTKRIEFPTFEQACEAKGISCDLPIVDKLPIEHQESIISYYKLVIITEYINNGWRYNYHTQKGYKYNPIFYVLSNKEKPSGFGFSLAVFDVSATFTHVGSRLEFKDAETAMAAAEKYKDLYLKYLLYP